MRIAYFDCFSGVAGDMILFPGAIVHAVNPYDGKRPRLTLSWNINKQAVPGPPLPFAEHTRRVRRR